MAIPITGMMDGHRILLAAAPGRHDVVVINLRVRDAAAVQEMLHPARWVVINKRALSKLVRADALLALLEGTVLPAIALNPHNSLWVQHLEVLGDKAGGSFSEGVHSVVKRAKDLGLRLRRGRRSVAARGRRASRLIAKIGSIRDEDVTIDGRGQ